MTFFGDLHLLYDMQESARQSVIRDYRPRSPWLARENEYLEDPESPEDDPCLSVHSFESDLEEERQTLQTLCCKGEEDAEYKWHSQLDYQEYLRSDYWESVKQAVKSRDRHKCRLCGLTLNLQVHHRWYPPRGTELQHLDALILLCSNCHDEQHQ